MSASTGGQKGKATSANDETTPLLVASITAPIGEGAEAEESHCQPQIEDEEAPLPQLQISLLCYASLVEPVAFFGIFPYINQMIERTGGISKDEVGFYSGMIESLFSATQMCVMVFWGRAADRFGRKPILVSSLFGVTCMTMLFGLSKSIWQMILFRCMSGVFAGTVVTVRAMLSENSSKSSQARVFSRFAFTRNLGIFIGPMIGGALESPADKFPSTFGRVQFFHDYPYAFSGFVIASIGLTAAIAAAIFLKETLHLHADKKNADEPPMTFWELLKYPGIWQVILIYNYVMMLAFAFTAVYPVFQYTPISLGGLEFSPALIAASLGFGGACQSLWILLCFPWLHKRYGTKQVIVLCAYVWPISFAIDSGLNAIRRTSLEPLFWTIFIGNIIPGTGVAMSFTAVQLAVNDMAPSQETFGTLNAFVLAVSSGLRAVIPAVSTSIYATGVKYQILWGQFFWVVLTLVAAGLTFVLIWFFPEKAEGKPQIQDDREDRS